jgi:5'-methylthioadenosine phosphorylase
MLSEGTKTLSVGHQQDVPLSFDIFTDFPEFVIDDTVKEMMMDRLGIISTATVMGRSDLLNKSSIEFLKTEFGETSVCLTNQVALILRHGNDPENHILPHRINYRANLKALQDVGVSETISINSTGSLKQDLKPGTIIVPDDFISLNPTPSIYNREAVHITPALNETIRQRIIRAAENIHVQTVQKGTYWQTTGPRLETKAEIRMMANFADMVGMTMANEAVIAQELEMPYASICTIDNYANGLAEQPLGIEEIFKGTRKNADRMLQIVKSYIQLFY